MTDHTPLTYFARLLAGERAIGSSTEHYWRWPVMVHWRWMLGRSIHGIRDGVVRGLGPFRPAVRTLIWFGPVGIELGWQRQRIEDWRWRRTLRGREDSDD